MAKTPTSDLKSITEKILRYYPDAPIQLVEKAYHFADSAHTQQKRSSGEPYIIHPAAVAETLADLQLDISTIIAGLLHDVVEDTSVDLQTIEKEFGKEISDLVDGVTKLSQITFRTSEEKQAENFRKMIVAMAKDIRVILLKLSDRLNNMRTLEHLAEGKQKLIAQETLDIYAPIANRLGIGWMKIELEDLCLRYLHPDMYYRLAQLVAKKKKERDDFIEEVTQSLQEKLDEYDIKCVIQGRAKSFYSIYKKMERRSADFEQIHDLIAFRIIVENITECYKALGVIHAHFKPIPGRIKDYIAIPKANGYQSLHTTVIGPKGERVEIQIRTQEMHQTAEGGIAAHWKYKEGKFDSRGRENVEWVNRLVQWHKDLADPSEFLETVRIDLFAEDVFVFTPKGEVKQLPHGSTPLDFAFAVHTSVGNHCVGAKVDGKIVSLKHRLKSGDTLEIITSPTQSPSKDWLKICKSSRAKTKIRAFIKTQERERSAQIGHELLNKELKAFDLNLSRLEKSGDLEKVALELGFKTLQELYIAVGYGRLNIDTIIQKLIPSEALERKLEAKKAEDETFLKRVFNAAKRRSEARNAVTVANLNDVLVRFARCCNPLPGDSIAGYITRGRGVTIHTVNCPRALDTDTDRKIDVKWNTGQQDSLKRNVKIRVLSYDEPGLLALMSQTISSQGVNIVSATIRTTKDKKAIAHFDVEVTNISQLRKILSALESKKGVLHVERVKS